VGACRSPTSLHLLPSSHPARLPQVVASHEGWDFSNEGTTAKPKMGYVSKTPGGLSHAMPLIMIHDCRPDTGQTEQGHKYS
jgi:hypothetical protein